MPDTSPREILTRTVVDVSSTSAAFSPTHPGGGPAKVSSRMALLACPKAPLTAAARRPDRCGLGKMTSDGMAKGGETGRWLAGGGLVGCEVVQPTSVDIAMAVHAATGANLAGKLRSPGVDMRIPELAQHIIDLAI